jgi:hypothetical protein
LIILNLSAYYQRSPQIQNNNKKYEKNQLLSINTNKRKPGYMWS